MGRRSRTKIARKIKIISLVILLVNISAAALGFINHDTTNAYSDSPGSSHSHSSSHSSTHTSKENHNQKSNSSMTARSNKIALAASKSLQVNDAIAANVAAASETNTTQVSNTSSAALGIYMGPGAISAHTQFEQWLGRPVPYAVDYIAYTGGWQKDFIDSEQWLMQPWGNWVKQEPGRRLVLGVPMLESADAGQFTQGVNGEFDTYFTALANELVENGLANTIIRLGYEGNCDTIGPWQATDNPQGYIQLYRHIVGVMRAVQGSAFSFDWSVCNGLQSGHVLDSFDSFYPGDDVVDIVSMDIYDVEWMQPSATPQGRWNYMWSRYMGINDLIQFANSHGKPLSFPEWGLYASGDSFAGGGDDPYFINQMARLINETNPVYQAYFDIDWGGGVLSDFPEGAATFKAIYGN